MTTVEQIASTLLPVPMEVVPVDEDFIVEGPLICEGAAAGFAGTRLVELLAEQWGVRIGRDQHVGEGPARLAWGATEPEIEFDQALGEEGYCLAVNRHGVQVVAGSGRGLLWGAMTLRQLVRREGERLVVPGVRIKDKPRYAWRGFMIDSGRSPNSLAKIKRIIRVCSTFKLNCLVFREGDDELNAVRYDRCKLGSENPHAFSIREIAELAGYARKHGIALIPEIESLGHSTAKGRHYPELISGGFEERYEGIGTHVRKSHLAPADERSLQLLGVMYEEWIAAARPPVIHLGLDEVRLPMEKQAEHLALLLPLLEKLAQEFKADVTPMMWSDGPKTPEAFRDKVIRCMWDYADGEPVNEANAHLLKQGIKELSEPGCAQPVWMAGGSQSKHTPYSRADYPEVITNLSAWSRWGAARPNFVGLLAVQWSGNMLDDWLPDFAACADYAWRPPTGPVDVPAELQRIKRQLATLKDATSPRPDEVDPHAWDAIWIKDGTWDREVLPQSSRK